MAEVAKHVHCVDTFMADGTGIQLKQLTTLEEFRKNIEGKPISYFVGKSPEACLEFGDESIDLIFIDGWHDMNSVMIDINSWKSKVKKGGVFVFHDYMYKDSYAGLLSVTLAVGEALTNKEPDGTVMSPDGKICYTLAWFINERL